MPSPTADSRPPRVDEADSLAADLPDLFVATVLDLTMLYVDGVEVYGEIRKQRPGMPVLLMSGFNEQDAIDQFTEANIGGFLQKPFGIEELRAMVRQLLTQSR